MAKRKQPMSYERKKAWVGYVFIAPWLIGFVFFFLRALVQSLVYSFNSIKIETTGLQLTAAGFQNYIYVLRKDPDFVRFLTGSVQGMLYKVPIIVIFSLFIAYILNQKFKGRVIARAVFFLPVIIASGVVINILKGDVMANTLLSGEKSSSLFQTVALQTMMLESGIGQDLVLYITTLIDGIFELSWKSGIQILLFLAGLQSIPSSYYEASSIEGATGWESFWKITFPMVSPIIVLNLIYTIIDGFTDYSDKTMQLISTNSNKLMIENSAAMSWIYFMVVFAIIGVVYRLVNKKVFYIVE